MWNLAVFIFAVFTAFYIPGENLLRKVGLKSHYRLVLSVILGIVLFAFQGLIFGYLGMRWLTYVYLAINFIFWVTRFTRPKLISFPKFDKVLALIIFFGVLFQLSSVWLISSRQNNEIFFCCRNVPDAVYHLSLINELTKRFPPYEPGMYGVVVQNYHYFANLVIAEVIRVYILPLEVVTYQYFSLLISLLLGLSGILLGSILNLGSSFKRWLLILFYFNGDIIYLFTAIIGKGFVFNSQILDDGTQFLTGPPRSFSVVILIAGISFLLLWLKERRIFLGLITALVFSSLIGFKVYAGLFSCIGFFFLGLYFLYKKDYKMIAPLLVVLFIAVAIYVPVNKNAGGLIFVNFWRFEDFIVNKMFDLSKLETARAVYLSHQNWLRVYSLEGLYFILYCVFLFGTLNLSLFQSRKTLSFIPKEINIFLIPSLLITSFIGLFYIQKNGGANTIQFILNNVFIFSIYAALVISYWLKRVPRLLSLFLCILLLLLTSSRSIYEGGKNFLDIYYHRGPIINKNEVVVIDKIKQDSDPNAIIVLSSRKLEDNKYLYISYLTNKPVYLAGVGILRDHGVDITKRLGSDNIPKGMNPTVY